MIRNARNLKYNISPKFEYSFDRNNFLKDFSTNYQHNNQMIEFQKR